MADHVVPHFCNDAGVSTVKIGVRKFMCMGASAPHDHPHIFLDMGSDNEIICPYCSTVYVFDKSMAPEQSEPPGCRVAA